MVDNTISTREWISYGVLNYGVGYGGVCTLVSDNWIRGTYWYIATI